MQLKINFYKYFCWDHTDIAPLTEIVKLSRAKPHWSMYMPQDSLELIMCYSDHLEASVQDRYSQEMEEAEHDPDDNYEPPIYSLCKW